MTSLTLLRLEHALLLTTIYSYTAVASEVCMIPFGSEFLMFYIKCPDYCCKYKNATQYCCSDCNRSINSDSCTPEQMWRYILYVGLGIAGGVILCYSIAFVIKNYKEPMKRACCKQRSSRVQDPSISLTSASAWAGALPNSSRLNRGRRPSNLDEDWAASVCSYPCPDPYARPPPPPAYADASPASGDCQREGAATPPPGYSDGVESLAAPIAANAATSSEPPPAYSEQAQQPLHR